MNGLRTPYQILNLSADAEPVVIEAAYKALIKKYHPDLWVNDPGAQRRAAAINEAFATLRDPAAKAECDRQVRAWRNAAHGASVQPVLPRSRRLWWGGWVAALIVGVAQFVPWADLGVQQAPLAPRTGATVKTASAPATPEEEGPGPRIDPLASAEMEWLRTAPIPATLPEAPGSQPDIDNYVAPKQAPAADRQPRASRPRAAPARKRATPARGKSSEEKEFLEREGYIY